MSLNKLSSRDTHFKYRTFGIFFIYNNFDFYRPLSLSDYENEFYNNCIKILKRDGTRIIKIKLIFKDYFLK